MTKKVRIVALRRDQIDLDRLAATLLAIVDDLDEETVARLATKGRSLAADLQEPGCGSEDEA